MLTRKLIELVSDVLERGRKMREREIVRVKKKRERERKERVRPIEKGYQVTVKVKVIKARVCDRKVCDKNAI